MNKTEDKKHNLRPQKRFRKLWPITSVLAIMAVSGVFLCNYTPRAYQPLPPDNPDEVSPYLTHELGPDFLNNIQLDKPFELLVEQYGLNDIVSTQFSDENFDGFSFEDPMFVFDTETIYMMGTLKYKNISSVITIISKPTMDAQGNVNMNIQSVRMGILPVTKLVTYLAQLAFDQSADCFEGEEDVAKITQAIIKNEPFDPIFEASGRQARITEFDLSEGLLELKFQPVPKDSPSQ